ncbi:MAG: MBG domain-containing protein, partial [Flavobacteriales bacterium]
ILDNNFEIRYEPTPIEILPATLTVTTQDASIVYGDDTEGLLTGIVGDLKNLDTFDDVFPEGISYSTDCGPCGALDSPYLIKATSANTSSNYDISYIETGLLTVSKYDLSVSVNNAIITYGQIAQPNFGITVNPEQLPLPNEESISEILGDLSFTPSDACTSSTIIAINDPIQPDNYNITYTLGNLTINKAALNIEILSTFITAGNPAPSSFNTIINGLVCNDPTPNITSYVIKNKDGVIQTGNLIAGEYSVTANISNLSGYQNYSVTQVPGVLFVNPSVGCNDRIKASDICKSPFT